MEEKIDESSFNKNTNIEISTEAMSFKNDETFQTGLVRTSFESIYKNV